MTAQLINAEDGYHLWSERYDRELIDIFAIQDEIAQAIAAALQRRSFQAGPAHAQLSGVRSATEGAAPDENLRTGDVRPRTGILRAGDCARSGVCRAPCAARIHPSPFDHAHGRPLPAVASVIRREALTSPRARPVRNRSAFPPGCSGAATDYDWAEAEGVPDCAGQSVRASRGSLGRASCAQHFGRFEESAAEMRRAVEKDPLSVIWRGICWPTWCSPEGTRRRYKKASRRWISPRAKFTRISP